MDSFEPDIKCYTFDRVIIDPHLDAMHARAWGLMHFGFHGVVADTSEPVDNGADDETSAEIFGEAVEFVNVALSIANVNTPIRLPQQSDRLAEIIELLIPRFDGAILSLEWKEAIWDRYVTGAPRPRTPSEQQYSDRKLRSRL